MDYDVRRMDIDERFFHLFNGTWFTKEINGNCYYSYSIYSYGDTLRTTDIRDFFPITAFEFFDFEYRVGKYRRSPENLDGHSISFELFYDLMNYKR